MTPDDKDKERAIEIARVRRDAADIAWHRAREAEKTAYSVWLEADTLFWRVDAGQADAIEQILAREQLPPSVNQSSRIA
jgi:hypothetical protein